MLLTALKEISFFFYTEQLNSNEATGNYSLSRRIIGEERYRSRKRTGLKWTGNTHSCPDKSAGWLIRGEIIAEEKYCAKRSFLFFFFFFLKQTDAFSFLFSRERRRRLRQWRRQRRWARFLLRSFETPLKIKASMRPGWKIIQSVDGIIKERLRPLNSLWLGGNGTRCSWCSRLRRWQPLTNARNSLFTGGPFIKRHWLRVRPDPGIICLKFGPRITESVTPWLILQLTWRGEPGLDYHHHHRWETTWLNVGRTRFDLCALSPFLSSLPLSTPCTYPFLIPFEIGRNKSRVRILGFNGEN